MPWLHNVAPRCFGSAPKKNVAFHANASPVRWILAKSTETALVASFGLGLNMNGVRHAHNGRHALGLDDRNVIVKVLVCIDQACLAKATNTQSCCSECRGRSRFRVDLTQRVRVPKDIRVG
jgi:hypothetical protein